MDLDDNVCLCFRVTRRKLENYVRRQLPQVPSQLSQCGGAGTGCGWCIPFLKQIFQRATQAEASELEQVSPQDYARRRAGYIREGKGTPPPHALDKGPESNPLLDGTHVGSSDTKQST